MDALEYEKITGKTLTDEEKVRVDLLIKATIEKIENILGYSLEFGEVKETVNYEERIWLKNRPVIEILEISQGIEYELIKNCVEIRNFKPVCACVYDNRKINIKYTKGYREFPKWLMIEIVRIVDNTVELMKKESKYTSYKIDDIAYTMKDLTTTNKDLLNEVVKKIYD